MERKDRALRMEDLVALTSYTRQRIYQIINDGDFPIGEKPGHRRYWLESEYQHWLNWCRQADELVASGQAPSRKAARLMVPKLFRHKITEPRLSAAKAKRTFPRRPTAPRSSR
jgi:predicted DNA-binding transcriptional regulator AlpA